MTATATASLLIKSLIVTTGYVPSYSNAIGEHNLQLTLSKGRTVRLVADKNACLIGEASPEEVAAIQAVAQHYAGFLRGEALPSAPAGLTTTHHIETEHEGGGLEVFEVAEAKEPKRLAALRGILKDCQCKVVEGKMVDTFSASAFIQVYDAVNEANKAKLLSFSLVGAIGACFKLINNQSKK